MNKISITNSAKWKARKYKTKTIINLSQVPTGYVNQNKYYGKCNIAHAHRYGYIPSVKLMTTPRDRRGPLFVDEKIADEWMQDEIERKGGKKEVKQERLEQVVYMPVEQPGEPEENPEPPQSVESEQLDAQSMDVELASTHTSEALDQQMGRLNQLTGLVEDMATQTQDALSKLDMALRKIQLLMDAWEVKDPILA